MKRMISSTVLLLLCFMMVVAVLSVNSSNTYTPDADSDISITNSAPEWVFLDDEYYSVVKETSEGFIAFEYIQKKEELQIE
ncbi:MAG: hypothetical protein IJM17_00095, partial [Firmicutes bacterium]|nr:hypothetical protein [Bacillota bacterium]